MKDFAALVLDRQIATSQQLNELVDEAASEPLYYRLAKRFPDQEQAIWSTLAEYLGIALIEPAQFAFDPSLANLIPANLAHAHGIVPLHRHGNQLDIALADPRQMENVDELPLLLALTQNGTDYTVVPHLARPSHIAELIKRLYGIGADSVHAVMSDPALDLYRTTQSQAIALDAEVSVSEGEEEAIIRFVNQLLLDAVRLGASDIHLEPFENRLAIRYRVDGMLQSEPTPAHIKHLESAIISRIKIMANLDITEKRRPQDGQIRLEAQGRPIDVRVSVLPTVYGQGLSLRILDRQTTFRHLDQLGMPEGILTPYRRVLELPYGLALVTGPTGSGKTTTLYACLNAIASPQINVITVEDPIEYRLEGITQIQVNPAIGLTFANLLRSILRHDPDVLMIGEIRDADTAAIAISSALTGHLVFSTLHTNDACSAPIRLLEMGLESYLVSSALSAVLAQRLVRLLCEHCCKPLAPDAVLPALPVELGPEASVFSPGQCERCRRTGYQGRTGLFELLLPDDALRQMILHQEPVARIRRQATQSGLQSLLQQGMNLVRQGRTTLTEVLRVAQDPQLLLRNELSQGATAQVEQEEQS